MVGHLRRERQRGDPGKPAAGDPEVQRGDREARNRAACRAADAGAVEYERPGEGDADVNGHGGREQPLRAGLTRQQNRPGGVRRRERVAARRERVHRRRDPAQRCSPGSGSKDAHAEG